MEEMLACTFYAVAPSTSAVSSPSNTSLFTIPIFLNAGAQRSLRAHKPSAWRSVISLVEERIGEHREMAGD